jgi:hypothetical protein
MKMRQFSKEQKIFGILTIFVVGLLFYANLVAFNLISVPAFVFDSIAYVALATAVSLTIVMVTVVNKDKREAWIAKTQEPNEKSDPNPPKVNLQKPTSNIELVFGEKKQPVKQVVIKPTKLFCPACRKEFSLGGLEGDYMINFGPPKPSNLIKYCPNCRSPISLKRKGVAEEDIWNDNE